ncbi:MAG: hypothetical protein ACON5B_04130 [Myxococcota bacterium]
MMPVYLFALVLTLAAPFMSGWVGLPGLWAAAPALVLAVTQGRDAVADSEARAVGLGCGLGAVAAWAVFLEVDGIVTAMLFQAMAHVAFLVLFFERSWANALWWVAPFGGWACTIYLALADDVAFYEGALAGFLVLMFVTTWRGFATWVSEAPGGRALAMGALALGIADTLSAFTLTRGTFGVWAPLTVFNLAYALVAWGRTHDLGFLPALPEFDGR